MQLCGGNVEPLCLSPFLLTSRIFSGVIIITRPRSFSPIFLRSYPARALALASPRALALSKGTTLRLGTSLRLRLRLRLQVVHPLCLLTQ